MNTCDVIIPAYNAKATLLLALDALGKQHIPKNWQIQILVCDDGSTDGTDEILHTTRHRLPVQVLSAPHAGIAAARNRGIVHSQADVLLFLGADIILRPGALAAHCVLHEQEPSTQVGGLGFVVWDPCLRPSPLMEWMNHGGPQNNFDALLGVKEASPDTFFYGSHVSVKREALAQEVFSEEFTGYGHEDHELGVRLAARGIKLRVLHRAIGLHRHTYTPDAFFARQAAVGKGADIFAQHLRKPPPRRAVRIAHRIQHIVYAMGVGVLLRHIVRYVGLRWSMPRLFAHSARYEYRRGVLHS